MRAGSVFLMLFVFLGCKDPAANVQSATVEEVEEEVAEPAQAEVIETITITPENSKLGFVGAKVTRAHDGGFGDFGGKLGLAEPIEGSQVEVTIQTASLFADEEKLTKHLKSPDFFDVEKYPTATFRSTSIKKTPGGFEMTGDLTLRETTKRITFPVTIDATANEVTATSEFSIDRKDFGIVYPGMPDDLIRDKVVIKLDMKLPRQTS